MVRYNDYAVNSAMVQAYWIIGKTICEVCGENDRAAYGKQVMKYLSDKLTAEFGKGSACRTCATCDSSIVHFRFAPHCVVN